MPKEVKLTVDVPGVSAQAFFDTVYGGDQCLKQFHSQFNHDENASVTDWAGGERTVTFHTPVDAPSVLKRLIGADVIRVIETQEVSADAAGAIIVRSTPMPQFPGSDRFTSTSCTTIRDAPGGCQVDASVTVKATGPYGLTGTIESFMAATALKSMQDFWGFCSSFVAKLLAAGQLAGAPPPLQAVPAAAAAPAAPAPAAAEREAEEEPFFDAVDVGALELDRIKGVRFEDAALLYMRYLCKTGDQQVAVLQEVEARLAGLQQQVAAVQAQQAQQAATWGGLWPSWAQLPDTLSSRQALLLAAAAATSAALLAVRWDRRQRT